MKYTFLLLLIISWWFFTNCSHNDRGIQPPVGTDSSSNVNVILIIGDDIGYEIPRCDGGESYSTPNLDTLAMNGMRFTQCYSSPLCSPSRIMLLTGKYNFRNYYDWGILNTNQLTIGNLLKDNGYKTYYTGKWQLDGGDASIKKFGFSSYIVWLPFVVNSDDENAGSRYKTPLLYSHTDYIPSAKVKNKYGDDIFTDSIENFIAKNKNNPFFVYYAMALAHKPFCPTPDDPDYVSWNASNITKSDAKYFPGMIKYMDKKIGQLVNFLKQNKLDKKTIIIFVGDNGTPQEIQSKFNGIVITGGKKSTTTYGTHVPLIVSWPGKISPGSVNNNLICFPDFLPTLAALTHSTISDALDPIDGVSFYDQLLGNYSNARSSIFCFYRYDSMSTPVRWVQDTRYKLYDTLINNYHAPGFYDMQNDIAEHNSLPDISLTPQEQNIKQSFRRILDSLK